MIDGKQFWYGAAYYPEHWDRSLWDDDARRMREAGFNTVRMGEFAWIDMEPREGEFDFGWLDDAVALLAEHGIRSILGTPTATIPAWMARRYPEVMACDVNGHRKPFSVRKDYCMSQPAFTSLSLRIVERMAAHYANNPNVVAFQTDNEYGASPCRCALCLDRFHDFLRARYGSVRRLNDEWGTWFWGTKYTDFDETGWPPDAPNPSHALDARRFFSKVNVDYNDLQVEILRRCAPGKPLTHNTHDFYGSGGMGVDFGRLLQPMDFASWDSYPGIETENRFPREAWANGLVWSFKRANFIVMEQQSGPGGWLSHGGGVAPGEMAMLAWQSIARGADGILFFRWRTSVSGQEQYWHGILNHDNVPRRRYREVAALGETLARVAPEILGTQPRHDVGVYFDYEQMWAGQIQPQSYDNAINTRDVALDMFGGLCALGMDAGVFTEGQDLSRYKAVLCPPLSLLRPEFVVRLTEYVENGGTLVLTPRTGAKTENHKMVMEPLPGLLRDLAGVEVEEYAVVERSKEWHVEVGGRVARVSRMREHLTAQSAEIVGVHRGGYMEGWAGVARRRIGQGTVWYLGALPDREGWKTLLPHLLEPAGVSGIPDLPPGIEIARRIGDGRQLTFVINHTAGPVTVAVPASGRNLLTGATVEGNLMLAPFEVALLQT